MSLGILQRGFMKLLERYSRCNMYDLARLDDKERSIIFRNTANKMKVNDAIIEKDFWVVLMLDYLFNKCKYRDSFTFKGGTSLSKGYSLIRRFSEDIDIILDWRVFGISENEPYELRSKTKQNEYNKEINELASAFIKNVLLSEIKEGMQKVLGFEVDMYCDKKEENIVIFKYPKLFTNTSILSTIKLEFGPLAALTPSETTKISSYINDYYPSVMSKPFTEVLTVKPERTFWEKITILHHEANRPIESKIPSRYSRHYYDVFMIGKSQLKSELIRDTELLNRVVEFKEKFYPRGWARYDLAKPGTLKLLPDEYRFKELKDDYTSMQDMLFGEKPTIHNIMEYIGALEKEINEQD